jgi:hypothetical protein
LVHPLLLMLHLCTWSVWIDQIPYPGPDPIPYPWLI